MTNRPMQHHCDVSGCDKAFVNKKDRDTHRVSKHSQGAKVVCHHCFKLFPDPANRKRHQLTCKSMPANNDADAKWVVCPWCHGAEPKGESQRSDNFSRKGAGHLAKCPSAPRDWERAKRYLVRMTKDQKDEYKRNQSGLPPFFADQVKSRQKAVLAYIAAAQTAAQQAVAAVPSTAPLMNVASATPEDQQEQRYAPEDEMVPGHLFDLESGVDRRMPEQVSGNLLCPQQESQHTDDQEPSYFASVSSQEPSQFTTWFDDALAS